MAPLETRVLLFEDPTIRASWALYGRESWYIGPEMDHYRCFQFFISETSRVRISTTANFLPGHSKVPNISSMDAAIAAENDLIKAFQCPSAALPNLKLEISHYNALKQLTKTFNVTTKQIKSTITLDPVIQQSEKQQSNQNSLTTNSTPLKNNNAIPYNRYEINYTGSDD